MHHYFGSKDQLLAATMRHLLTELGRAIRANLAKAGTPRERISAIIAGNFAVDQFQPAVIAAWLAFYVQSRTTESNSRLLRIYAARLASNLTFNLRFFLPRNEARRIAEGTASMIDGVWIRQALSDAQADRKAAIAMVEDYVENQIAAHRGPSQGPLSRSFSMTDEFDFIIVGAGSAGCAMASRLSEDPKNRVLVLEFGGTDAGPLIQMPAALSYPMNMPIYDWGYESEPEPHLGGRRLATPRGKVIGGSSSINGMVYVRGHACDFDTWEEMGASGWGYRHVLPYYKRLEQNPHGQAGWRGTERSAACPARHQMESPVSRLPRRRPAGGVRNHRGLQRRKAGRLRRHGNDGHQGPPLVSRQCLSETRPETRGNLELIKGAPRPQGPDREQPRRRRRIRDRRRNSGSKGRPRGDPCRLVDQLAEDPDAVRHRSGRRNLSELGIDVDRRPARRRRQPAGSPGTLHPAGLQTADHALQALESLLQGNDRRTMAVLQEGLGASNQFESCAFIRSRAGVKYPDIQYHFLPFAVRYDGQAAAEGHGFQAHVGPMRSKSRGHVSLTSSDPKAKPSILFNYMSHDEDWEDFRTCIRLTREIFGQEAFADYRGKEIQPGDKVQSDEELNDFIREHVESAYHPCGTCRMGAKDDPMAVVDPECRVIGVDGLRVADSSIFPLITNGNLNGPSIMVGEKASDHILGKDPLPASNQHSLDPPGLGKQSTLNSGRDAGHSLLQEHFNARPTERLTLCRRDLS